jgi:Concanavalin A-like lectin/glucanases superfamily
MATVVKTWVFATDAEGLADEAASSSIAFAWQSGDSQSGSGGCVKFTQATKSTNSTERAKRSATGQTWETWGVPAGSIVTQVQITAWYKRLMGNTKLTSHTISARILDSSNAKVHSAGDLLSAVTLATTPLDSSAWPAVQAAGTARAVNAGKQASNTDVRLELEYSCVTSGSSGSAAVDERFDGIQLTITYTPLYSRSAVMAIAPSWDTAFAFDGLTGGVTLPLITTSLTDVTLECWVKLADATTHGMFMHLGAVDSGFGIGCGGNDGNYTTIAGNYVWGLIDTKIFVSWGGGPYQIPLDSGFHHVVLTVDAAHYWSLYLDGSLVGGNDYPDNPVTPATESYIARNRSIEYFKGTIARAAIYNSALNATRVAAHFAAGGSDADYAAAVITDSPVGFWKLNEASGTDAHDSIGTNTGSIVGGVTLGQIGVVTGGVVAFTAQRTLIAHFLRTNAMTRAANYVAHRYFAGSILRHNTAGAMTRPAANPAQHRTNYVRRAALMVRAASHAAHRAVSLLRHSSMIRAAGSAAHRYFAGSITRTITMARAAGAAAHRYNVVVRHISVSRASAFVVSRLATVSRAASMTRAASNPAQHRTNTIGRAASMIRASSSTAHRYFAGSIQRSITMTRAAGFIAHQMLTAMSHYFKTSVMTRAGSFTAHRILGAAILREANISRAGAFISSRLTAVRRASTMTRAAGHIAHRYNSLILHNTSGAMTRAGRFTGPTRIGHVTRTSTLMTRAGNFLNANQHRWMYLKFIRTSISGAMTRAGSFTAPIRIIRLGRSQAMTRAGNFLNANQHRTATVRRSASFIRAGLIAATRFVTQTSQYIRTVVISRAGNFTGHRNLAAAIYRHQVMTRAATFLTNRFPRVVRTATLSRAAQFVGHRAYGALQFARSALMSRTSTLTSSRLVHLIRTSVMTRTSLLTSLRQVYAQRTSILMTRTSAMIGSWIALVTRSALMPARTAIIASGIRSFKQLLIHAYRLLFRRVEDVFNFTVIDVHDALSIKQVSISNIYSLTTTKVHDALSIKQVSISNIYSLTATKVQENVSNSN